MIVSDNPNGDSVDPSHPVIPKNEAALFAMLPPDSVLGHLGLSRIVTVCLLRLFHPVHLLYAVFWGL